MRPLFRGYQSCNYPVPLLFPTYPRAPSSVVSYSSLRAHQSDTFEAAFLRASHRVYIPCLDPRDKTLDTAQQLLLDIANALTPGEICLIPETTQGILP